MEIKYYRRMRNVNRLALHNIHRTYNLLEHSFMVTVLFRHFASKEDVAYDMVVLDYVMHHDVLETVTGDLPYPIKHHSKNTESNWASIEDEITASHVQLTRYTDEAIKDALSPRQRDLLSVCDLLDLWIFCKEEVGLGNVSHDLQKVIDTCERVILREHNFSHVKKYMASYEF